MFLQKHSVHVCDTFAFVSGEESMLILWKLPPYSRRWILRAIHSRDRTSSSMDALHFNTEKTAVDLHTLFL